MVSRLCAHQPGRRCLWGPSRKVLERRIRAFLERFPPGLWGRVVPDIPAFWRELVATLAEEG